MAQPIGDPLVAGLLRLKLLHIHIDPNDVVPAAQSTNTVIGVCEPGLKLSLSRHPILILGMSDQMGNPTAVHIAGVLAGEGGHQSPIFVAFQTAVAIAGRIARRVLGWGDGKRRQALNLEPIKRGAKGWVHRLDPLGFEKSIP